MLHPLLGGRQGDRLPPSAPHLPPSFSSHSLPSPPDPPSVCPRPPAAPPTGQSEGGELILLRSLQPIGEPRLCICWWKGEGQGKEGGKREGRRGWILKGDELLNSERAAGTHTLIQRAKERERDRKNRQRRMCPFARFSFVCVR